MMSKYCFILVSFILCGLSINNGVADDNPVPIPPGTPTAPGWTDKPSGGSSQCSAAEYFDPELNECIKKPTPLPGHLGTGAYGANRVLKTPIAHLGVAGTFTKPTIDGGSSWIRDENGEVIYNVHGVRPTMYFGAQGPGVHIDTGLQYEPKKVISLGNFAGWTYFLRVSNSRYPTKWIWKQIKLTENFTSIYLKLDVASDGQVKISAPNLGTELGPFQPYWLHVTNDDLNAENTDQDKRNKFDREYKARRVIGITQSFTIVDGAKMNGATFTGGKMAKVYNENGRLRIAWTPPQNPTGNWLPSNEGAYEYGPTAPNGDPNSPSFATQTEPPPWMVDFDSPYTRNRDYNGTHPSLTPNEEANRFITETVNINMIKHPGNWVGNPKKTGKPN